MMDQLLPFEIRLLILRYGCRKVLEAMATVGDQSLEDLERQLVALEARIRSRVKRTPKPAQELIAAASKGQRETERLLSAVINRYQNRTFLPQLRDVERFLNHRGVAHTRLKSRVAALPKIIDGLSRLSQEQLKALAEDIGTEGQSDFALLAHQIMGGQKGDRGE